MKGVDQEERTKRNRWLGKGDQSSQNWSFTITVQAANSSAVSKADSPWQQHHSDFGWNNELPRTFSFPYLAILSKRLVDWLARMPGLPGIQACLPVVPVSPVLPYVPYYSTFYGLLMNNAERRNEPMLAQKILTHVLGIFFYTWVSFLFTVQIPMVYRVKENLEQGQEEIQVLFKMQVTEY